MSFKVIMYNVNFFSLFSVMAILEAILDATVFISVAEGKSRHLHKHLWL